MLLPGAGTWLVDLNAGADAVSQRQDVTGARLSVDEILARHQAQARRSASLAALHGERPDRAALPAHRHRSRLRRRHREPLLRRSREGVEWEEREFTVNGARLASPGRPSRSSSPRRCFSPPLALDLDERYRYRLEGTETVDGVAC